MIPPGYEKYNTIRADPALCFLERVGKPDEKAVAAEQRANDFMDGYVHFRIMIFPYISINIIIFHVSDVFVNNVKVRELEFEIKRANDTLNRLALVHQCDQGRD